MVKVLIKKLSPEIQLPSYKTIGSSGMDLKACIEKPINLEPKNSCLVPTGLAVAILCLIFESSWIKRCHSTLLIQLD